MFACRKCGRIWAPANDPGTCPCGQRTQRFDVRVAVRLNKARQEALRKRAMLRAERRRRLRQAQEVAPGPAEVSAAGD